MSAEPAARGLRVLTLNLLAPDKGDYRRRRPVLVEGLARLRPDVVAFQVRCGVHGPRLGRGRLPAGLRPAGRGGDHFGVVADLALPPRPPGSWDGPGLNGG